MSVVSNIPFHRPHFWSTRLDIVGLSLVFGLFTKECVIRIIPSCQPTPAGTWLAAECRDIGGDKTHVLMHISMPRPWFVSGRSCGLIKRSHAAVCLLSHSPFRVASFPRVLSFHVFYLLTKQSIYKVLHACRTPWRVELALPTRGCFVLFLPLLLWVHTDH